MNWYTTIAALRERVQMTRTDADAQITGIIENVSRQIDLWCGRHFYVRQRTWYWGYAYPYIDPRDGALLTPDIISLASLKTDTAGDRTYATTWAPTDYDLLPGDAPYEDPPSPYWKIARAVGGDYGFLTSPRSIQAVGKGGYYEVLERSAATVGTGGITDSATTLPLSSVTPIEVGMTLLIDTEQLFVTALDATPTPDVATVVRGVNGTTAAAHLEGAAIDVYTYPVVGESCLTQVQRRFERTIGRPNRGAEDTQLRAFASLDRDIQDALVLLRRRGC